MVMQISMKIIMKITMWDTHPTLEAWSCAHGGQALTFLEAFDHAQLLMGSKPMFRSLGNPKQSLRSRLVAKETDRNVWTTGKSGKENLIFLDGEENRVRPTFSRWICVLFKTKIPSCGGIKRALNGANLINSARTAPCQKQSNQLSLFHGPFWPLHFC